MAPSHKAASSDPSSSTHPPDTKKPHHAKGKGKGKHPRPQHKQHPSSSAPSSSPSGANALPGVQKLKAALRQTRRLLARDGLAADVRVQTERRLRALEGDLAAAERGRVERAMAARYHHVRFFERQKVVRKIVQAKRRVAELGEGAGEGEGEGGEKKKGKGKGKGKKERREAEKAEGELAALRVDLNYVLHYPKTRKYISLFPPELRQTKAGAADDGDEDMEDDGEEGKAETDRQREEIREEIRARMDAGELSWEPEVELAKGEGKGARAASGSAATQYADGVGKKGKAKTGGEAQPEQSAAKVGGVADDDFFAMDDGEDSEMDE